jgi:hypothetical protein
MTEDSADQIADAIKTLAVHVKYLGVGNAATPMGAIEYLATQIREGSLALQSLAGAAGKIASAIEELAAALREGNGKLARLPTRSQTPPRNSRKSGRGQPDEKPVTQRNHTGANTA